MFSDPDWYVERLDNDSKFGEPLRIDLSHLSTEPLELVLEDMYADNARSRLQSKGPSDNCVWWAFNS